MPSPPPPPPPPSNGYTAQVLSGTGQTYSCLMSDGSTQTVTVLGIDPGETIPAGYQMLAALVNGTYYSAVPIWLT